MYKFIVFLVTVSILQPCASFAYYHGYSTSVTSDYFVTGGADVSDGTAAVFDNNALTKLGASDDSRIQSDGSWPTNGVYDEGRYIEFVFSPNLPSGATITSAAVTHEFRRSGILTGAKLEVWDGQSFANESLSLPSASNTDFSETKNVTSYINTPAKINSLKIRFLAYRGTEASIKTSHDLIKITVTADGIGALNPTPTPTPPPVGGPTAAPTSTPTPISTPIPTPTASALTSAAPVATSPAPTPARVPTTAPSPSPSPTSSSAVISAVTLKPTQSAALGLTAPSLPPSPTSEIKKPIIRAARPDETNQQFALISQTKSKSFALLAVGVAFLIVYFRRWRKS